MMCKNPGEDKMILSSMTGFGSGSATYDDGTLTAEIATVNRRQLEMRFALPRELNSMENELRKQLQEQLSRGMVSVRIFRSGGIAGAVGVNRERLKALTVLALELKNEFKLEGEISPSALLALPGVLDDMNGETASESLQQAAREALKLALEGLNRMRRTEGEALGRELGERLKLLRAMQKELCLEARNIEAALKQRMLDKLTQSGLNVDPHDERFLKELLFYADKSDVTEELTRLESHFGQFEGFLAGGEGGGRSMDFLIQEMFREITTLGNKAGSGPVARVIVRFKSELEKMREQVQNLE